MHYVIIVTVSKYLFVQHVRSYPSKAPTDTLSIAFINSLLIDRTIQFRNELELYSWAQFNELALSALPDPDILTPLNLTQVSGTSKCHHGWAVFF